MKIFLTGSRGQLGSDLQLACRGRHQVFAFDLDLDITDRAAVVRKVSEIGPEVVVNAAAYTDVDGAESSELEAYRVNALGTHNLAVACGELGIPLMHVSTDFVFDGKSQTPYTEFDRPAPEGVYGKSKYAGELYVTSLLSRFYICRTSWLFGAAGKNFVKTMLRLGRERDRLTVVDDQEGSPTYSRDLAYKLLEILEMGAFGIYHVSNTGSCTWCQFAREIFEVARIETPVSPISTVELGRPAPRPRYSVMKGMALEMQRIPPMRHYRAALEQFIRSDLPAWESGEGGLP